MCVKQVLNIWESLYYHCYWYYEILNFMMVFRGKKSGSKLLRDYKKEKGKDLGFREKVNT